MRIPAALAIIVVSLLPASSRAQDLPDTALRVYEHALERMHALPQPERAAFTATVDTQGLKFSLQRSASGEAAVSFTIQGDGQPHRVLDVIYRDAEPNTALKTDRGDYAWTRVPLFNPTWSGVNSWIRGGLEGEPNAKSSSQQAPDANTGMPVITILTAIGPGNYHIRDAGQSQCANGDTAIAVKADPVGDEFQHPLTDAVIDSKTGLLCTVRFRIPVKVTGIYRHASGSLQLHLGYAGNYYLVTDEVFEVSARRLFSTVHWNARVAFSNFTFPKTLDSRIFESP